MTFIYAIILLFLCARVDTPFFLSLEAYDASGELQVQDLLAAYKQVWQPCICALLCGL